jgi:GDP-L-fucose synthase
MDLRSKILIAGHTGLLGSAIRRRLETLGYQRLLLRTHEELDLTRQDAVEELFSWERPDYVFLADGSARDSSEGDSCYADLLYQSLAAELNVVSSAHQAGVKRLLFLGTSCIYPRWAQRILDEARPEFEQMHETSRAHAIAKVAGVELCNAYNRQHGCRFLAAMPSNQFGRGHTYDLHHSNLIPAMIAKLHYAKLNGEPTVVLPGAGNVRRGFLYNDDVAVACVSLMNLNDRDFAVLLSNPSGPLINIDCEEDLTARELAALVADIVMFKGQLLFEERDSEDNSQYRLNTFRAQTLGRRRQPNLKEKLQQAYRDFLLQTDPTQWESSPGLSLDENHYPTPAQSGKA